MSRKFLTLAGAAALVAGGVAAGALVSGAEAQQAAKAPIILIVDQSALVSQSDAGKTIPGQVQSIQTGVQKEFDAEAEKIKKDIRVTKQI